MSVRLSSGTLSEIAERTAIPIYDRSKLTSGIVHFGVGNFHRAHQAVYLDDLFNTGADHDFAILGAGVMPSDARMRETLCGQDYLTTVVEQDNNRSAARVTGPMIDILPVGEAQPIIDKLADPSIRIVSLTVTEGGYFIDSDGRFDPTHPAIAADGGNPAAPKTVFGLIAAGLKARRDCGVPAFTVMSCDNIPHNGRVARAAVVGTARLSDPSFADWIDTNVAFPNGMVDRITPATGQREIDICRETYGIEDGWPVFCEEFKQWVLEDNFPMGRPALEKVGVQFVPDVAPFEHMKLRILNGGHAAIAYPAALMDIHFVHEAMENDLIRAFLEKLTKEEIIPVVPPVPDTSLEDYRQLVERRFLNPKIGDTIPRLAQDGSNRQPKFIVPTIRDRLKAGRGIEGLALESALWCRYLAGPSDTGKELAYNDPNIDAIRRAAMLAKDDPKVFLQLKDVYGELGEDETMIAGFTVALESLYRDGTQATLKAYIEKA